MAVPSIIWGSEGNVPGEENPLLPAPFWQLLLYCYGRALPFVIPLIYSCLLLLSWLLALNLMLLGKNSASDK